MEPLIYLMAYAFTIWFIFFPRSLSKKSFFITWYLFSISLSIIIRSSIGLVESADIDGYIVNMKKDAVIPYFLREPIFWFGIRFLYDIFNNGIVVFIFLDTVLFLLVYVAISKCKKVFYPFIESSNINYLYFAFFLFFPYVMGMHNIYRQLLATFIFLIAITLIADKKIVKGFLTSLVAVLIHNPVGLFFTILVISMKNNFLKYSSFILLFIVIIFMQSLLQIDSAYMSREGSIEIGSSIAYLYLVVLYILLLIILYIEFKSNRRTNTFFVSIYLMLAIIYSYSVFMFSSEQSQRIIFYIFGILFPFYGFYFEHKFKPVIYSRLIFFHATLAPLILIYNTTLDIGL
jgi:hypothetical protein